MEENKRTDSDNLKNALCFIPFIAFVLFFIENNKTEELKKNIKYGVFLFGGYVLLQFILGFLLGGILFLVYMIISVILFYKAYQGEKITLDHIDNLEKKVKDEFGSLKK